MKPPPPSSPPTLSEPLPGKREAQRIHPPRSLASLKPTLSGLVPRRVAGVREPPADGPAVPCSPKRATGSALPPPSTPFPPPPPSLPSLPPSALSSSSSSLPSSPLPSSSSLPPLPSPSPFLHSLPLLSPPSLPAPPSSCLLLLPPSLCPPLSSLSPPSFFLFPPSLPLLSFLHSSLTGCANRQPGAGTQGPAPLSGPGPRRSLPCRSCFARGHPAGGGLLNPAPSAGPSPQPQAFPPLQLLFPSPTPPRLSPVGPHLGAGAQSPGSQLGARGAPGHAEPHPSGSSLPVPPGLLSLQSLTCMSPRPAPSRSLSEGGGGRLARGGK